MTQPDPYDDEDELEDAEEDEEVDLGPDERDLDLLDGTWEDDYYAGRVRTRDWRNITVAISLLIVVAMVLSLFAVVL
ncbi:MAG: hypothetical protein WD557_00915 [Dehalococcoidia bacterium]